MTGVVDSAFRSIPKNASCFFIWRIEKMQVVPVPKEKYGMFYNGDSYILYSATEFGQSGGSAVKQKPVVGPLEMHIHFWLGSDTTQDEAGVAAYKTVELDDYLGGAPIQHRETEGRESKRFLSYFKEGIRVLKGGVASGFNHVSTEFEPKLYSVKGKRSPVVRQMSRIAWEEMNDGDVFVLDTKEAIFVWTGKHANNMEKIQGAKLAQKLKAEQGGATVVFAEDGQETQLPASEQAYLTQFLDLGSKAVTPASEAESDDLQDRRTTGAIKLFRCSDDDGTLRVEEVKSGPLTQADLCSDDSFIIDNGEHGIWVWVGKRASQKERTEAMRNANGFIKKKSYAAHTPVTRVIDGGEPTEFKSLFRGWKERNQTVGLGRQHSSGGKIAKTVQTKFDAATLHETPALAAQTQMVDDGRGKREVWRVENFDLAPVSGEQHGTFFGGDCYVIMYTYSTGGRENYIVYYWLGAKSSVDEQGTAALKTVELDDRVGGRAVQVRVVQGKEPTHFMAIFGGKMVVFSGGKASSFDGKDAKDEGPGDTYLMHVRGTSEFDTKAVQVELRAASLNSNDVFVLVTPTLVFVWCGKGSTGDEREMAKRVAERGKTEIVTVYESQEKQDFWDAIGGKEPYANNKRLSEYNDACQARLFQCSNASGRFKVEEIVDFNQSDLVEDDVMLLDAWDSIFIWVGQGSNREEQKQAENTAKEYLRTDPAGRSTSTPITRITQGNEPPNFTGFFGVWDSSMWKNMVTFEQLKAELSEPGRLPMTLAQTNDAVGNVHRKEETFPLELLLEKDPTKLPGGVDPFHKELSLSPEDFTSTFKMDPYEYDALPHWKKKQLKQKVGLF